MDPREDEEENKRGGLGEKISGFGQSIIGEIEQLAGVINADPLAQEEGGFNIEVGNIRDEIEESQAEEEEDK